MYGKTQSLAKRILCTVLAAAGIYAALRWLLPWTLPFLIAGALSALMEPAVRFLCVRCRLPRSVSAGLCSILLLTALGTALFLLAGRAIDELKALAARLPDILEAASTALGRVQARVSAYIGGAPDWLSELLRGASDGLAAWFAALPGRFSDKLFSALSAFAGALPSVLLFAVTSGVGVYFLSASRPSISRFLRRQFSARWLIRGRIVREEARGTLLRWLRAQLIMTIITFCELLAAFWLLRVDYALLLALVTALIDALPVLGTGTVLLPWAAAALLMGNVPLGLGLVVSYAAVTLVRSCIQAKLLGDQLGLHPLVTLAAIYVGWCAMGVWGMLLFPVLAILIKQLNDRGLLRLWKTEEEGA